ncbi:MAG: hypothetical protein ACOZNI_31030 [Myxococcota bacterium]
MLTLLLAPAVAAGITLEGTWRVHMAVATRAKVPVVGDAYTVTESVVQLDVREDGTARWTVCDARIDDSGSAVRTVLPPAFVAALPDREATVAWEDGRLVIDPGVERLGLREGGAVFDADGDGRPGLTVQVDAPLLGEGEVWMVQRGHVVLEALNVGQDRITGRVRVYALEQRVLGAEPRVLGYAPRIVPLDRGSAFVMVRGGC